MTIEIRLDCAPPKATSQGKRLSMRGGKPHFFKKPQMVAQENTWAALLAPFRARHAARLPLTGAVQLSILFTVAHLKATKDKFTWLPKTTRPDVDNMAKAVIDQLVTQRFLVDDGQIFNLSLRKMHGPERHVGVDITIESE